jgi:hypothetical protein
LDPARPPVSSNHRSLLHRLTLLGYLGTLSCAPPTSSDSTSTLGSSTQPHAYHPPNSFSAPWQGFRALMKKVQGLSQSPGHFPTFSRQWETSFRLSTAYRASFFTRRSRNLTLSLQSFVSQICSIVRGFQGRSVRGVFRRFLLTGPSLRYGSSLGSYGLRRIPIPVVGAWTW